MSDCHRVLRARPYLPATRCLKYFVFGCPSIIFLFFVDFFLGGGMLHVARWERLGQKSEIKALLLVLKIYFTYLFDFIFFFLIFFLFFLFFFLSYLNSRPSIFANLCLNSSCISFTSWQCKLKGRKRERENEKKRRREEEERQDGNETSFVKVLSKER